MSEQRYLSMSIFLIRRKEIIRKINQRHHSQRTLKLNGTEKKINKLGKSHNGKRAKVV